MQTNTISMIPAFVQKNISLADKNWFRTGGSAEYFAQPTTDQEMQELIAWSRAHNLPITLLGKGANVLISDEGISGCVLKCGAKRITHVFDNDTVLVTADAGVDFDDLIAYCLAHNIGGLEEFSGIPSTVGGAIYINLHYYEFLIEQFVHAAQIIDVQSGEVITVDRGWFEFGYDTSRLHSKKEYLLRATFRLKQVSDLEAAYARGRSVEIIRHRRKRYPYEYTCGSFFRNFHDDEVSLVINNKKMIYVAYYLDQLSLKGTLRVGGASVSYQHANMIVSSPQASSADIIMLVKTMQERVYEAFGIIPQPECQLLGFSKYPLL